MNADAQEVVSIRRARGRPRNLGKADIAERLMDAAETLLHELSVEEVTERLIAVAAGASVPTIHYYFTDKNGLLFALVERYLGEVDQKLLSLRKLDPHGEDTPRAIAAAMIEAHHAKPWIAKIAALGMLDDNSPIARAFMKRRGPRSLLLVRDALIHHAQAKYAAGRIDEALATRTALSLMCLTAGSLYLNALAEPLGVTREDMRRAPWIDHVAAITAFHIYLLAGGSVEQLIKKG